MKRFLSLTLCLAMVTAASVAFAATSGTTDRDNVERHFVVDGPGVLLTSSSSSLAARGYQVDADTFALYGGPNDPTEVEGRFELINHTQSDWGDGSGGDYTGAPGQWTPVDNTDNPLFWHRDQFNAQTLGTTQPSPNHAMWSGVMPGDYGLNYQGYGNSWNDVLLYEGPTGAGGGETVALDFYFHHDTEPGYDYFNVEYDSAGTWTSVLAIDGSDKDGSNVFNAPGVQFSTVQTAPILYVGGDYGGPGGDQIRIQLSVTSDGAWSDQDGLWTTTAGAAQLDQITMTTSQGSFTEDYEAVLVPPAKYLFHPDKAPFAGDFSQVYNKMTDIDPCVENDTPVMAFVDQGQIIRNGPGINGLTFIDGGSTSPDIDYGLDNYTVNYTGGLSLGEVAVYNEVQSPPIEWDLPGTEDDAVEIAGAKIRFDVWRHLPLGNGYFYVWAVRGSTDNTASWSGWADRNFVYYGNDKAWLQVVQFVSDLLPPGPTHVQMSIGAIDYADVFGFAGTAATPSPVVDNAAFFKFRLGGPTFATRTIDTAQDGFPTNGSIDVSTQATRDALDVPFSMARDVNTGLANIAGDSIMIDVKAVIPDATIADIRMVWALKTNPVFEDAIRQTVWRAKDENLILPPAGGIWRGEVVAQQSTTSAGAPVTDRYFVDIPDVDMMYPGDVLHYYVQASDTMGRTTTWPADISGFLDFSPLTAYDRLRTVRALPTIKDTAGTQPEILVWNDFGRRGGENEWLQAFQQLGYGEGVDFDTYTTQGPSSGVGNGLGSAGVHGATADQLGGYHHMFYFAGNLSSLLLSNGTDVGNNDKGNDIDVMEQWNAKAGVRNCAYFGDYIASALVNDSAEGLTYVGTPMGIAYGDEDVRDVIGDQTAPKVVPNSTTPYPGIFNTQFISYGGCLVYNQFDQIQPAAGASAGHLFTTAAGVPIPENPDPALGGVASVINPTTNGVSITFPYASYYVYNIQERAVNTSPRVLLFGEILNLFAAAPGTVGSTGRETTAFARPVLGANPNPFNPSTEVSFSNTFGKRGSVKVFNLRGELVKTLHNGEFTDPAGFSKVWDGTDNRGATVASGVYVIQAQADGYVDTKKAALVK